MDSGMQLYYDYTVSPLGRLFYDSVWAQLGVLSGKKILDFGSGFCFTTNHLAEQNDVTALEIDESIIKSSVQTGKFTQLCGDVTKLTDFADGTFDVVICHLVLEFTQNREEIMSQLCRVVKNDGFISVVRHNRNGRIVQAVVQDFDLDEAKRVLRGEPSFSSAFGNISYYEDSDLLAWAGNNLTAEKVYGVRVLASLHGSDINEQPDWAQKMLQTEKSLYSNPDFVKIAYFNHLILRKI